MCIRDRGKGGCFACGEAHYARDCPKVAGAVTPGSGSSTPSTGSGTSATPAPKPIAALRPLQPVSETGSPWVLGSMRGRCCRRPWR
eukprot:7982047-Alexandrium_andersonii.AAC.1